MHDELTWLGHLSLSFHFHSSLQDFTVLPTELFRRYVIHSSLVIFLPTTSLTETFCRLYVRR